MKHVIYSTEFYSGNGTFLREEENDAYFNTIPEDSSGSKEKEEVVCPYCHSGNGYRMTDGFVYTYKIEPQPEL